VRKPKRRDHPPIVLIEWHDSRSLTVGWSDLETVQTKLAERDFDELLVSVGFLLRTTKRFVVICLSIDNQNANVDQTLQIPAGAIVRMKTIRAKRGYREIRK
jgi:hypothetical protein